MMDFAVYLDDRLPGMDGLFLAIFAHKSELAARDHAAVDDLVEVIRSYGVRGKTYL